MSSAQSIVDYIAGQLGNAGVITTKKMFGEYGIYCDGKIIGVICEDVLFLKSTQQGLEYCGNQTELAPAYEGAKPGIVITDKHLENIDWITKLVKITYQALPEAKPKKK